MSKSILLKLSLVVVILGGAIFVALRLRQPHPVTLGDPAPDFTLPALSAGPLSLRDFRKQVVVLNFWATWCPPCVEETPSLEQFAERMRGIGVAVVGVSVDEDPAALQKFVATYRLSYPILRDADRAVATRYGTFKFPESYILDRNGNVADKLIGAYDWQDPRLAALVRDLAQDGSPKRR